MSLPCDLRPYSLSLIGYLFPQAIFGLLPRFEFVLYARCYPRLHGKKVFLLLVEDLLSLLSLLVYLAGNLHQLLFHNVELPG